MLGVLSTSESFDSITRVIWEELQRLHYKMVLVLALKYNEQYFVLLSKGELITQYIHVYI